MNQDELIAKLTEMLEIQQKLHETAIDMLKPAIEAQREVVANWIMGKGFATGHGDSIVDLLDQLQWQIEEKEREACANVCDQYDVVEDVNTCDTAEGIAIAIRARGQA